MQTPIWPGKKGGEQLRASEEPRDKDRTEATGALNALRLIKKGLGTGVGRGWPEHQGVFKSQQPK